MKKSIVLIPLPSLIKNSFVRSFVLSLLFFFFFFFSSFFLFFSQLEKPTHIVKCLFGYRQYHTKIAVFLCFY